MYLFLLLTIPTDAGRLQLTGIASANTHGLAQLGGDLACRANRYLPHRHYLPGDGHQILKIVLIHSGMNNEAIPRGETAFRLIRNPHVLVCHIIRKRQCRRPVTRTCSAPLIPTAIKPTAIKNDRWYEALFGAPPRLLPVGNPARDTNR
jgi:hypothetical protein